MILYNITNSPYWFLVKDGGMIAVTAAEAWVLAANGMPSKGVTSGQLAGLNTQLRALANRPLYNNP